MRDVVADNALLLPVMSRFGIPLGFGDSTVGQVCSTHAVDAPTFLAVANFISKKPFVPEAVNASSLVRYLKNAHSYFLDYRLPWVRARLIEAISTVSDHDFALLTIRFFDSYVEEVRRHMEFENSCVFDYVEALIAGNERPGYRIARFKDTHAPIAEKLREIKDILICHYTSEERNADLMNSLLFDLVICERDLNTHCAVEDHIFVPAVERLESHVTTTRPATVAESDNNSLDANGDIELTPRERDIISAIARGKSNKEIADELCLSVHTVATHRRNVCAKLDIHSAAGITIYAILHGIVRIEDIRRI
ncbi:MAG: LuxR C-terminal-related transcriptional regulator [Muribaculaceae bacterium]|nr:LuxR C-terminal-related transcriptional regulator [Muribaculaceae bacterium]